jgi:hypothetical protein
MHIRLWFFLLLLLNMISSSNPDNAAEGSRCAPRWSLHYCIETHIESHAPLSEAHTASARNFLITLR